MLINNNSKAILVVNTINNVVIGVTFFNDDLDIDVDGLNESFKESKLAILQLNCNIFQDLHSFKKFFDKEEVKVEELKTDDSLSTEEPDENEESDGFILLT
jgi:hypothetical protein